MTGRTLPHVWTAALLGVALLLSGAYAAAAAAPPPSPAGPPTTLPRDPQHPPLKLAILVFPGVEVIDLGGPYEVFTEAAWSQGAVFDVYTVALKAEPFDTKPSWGGLKLTPDYTLANAPRPDILVVPGGNIFGTWKDPVVQQWIRSTADSARYVMSVCNGAYLLGASGLLDGLKATTAAPLIDGLKGVAPTCRPVYDRRVVDTGGIITTAGLSSGIDGALHLVEKVAGHDVAFVTALNMEYNWQPEGDYARAALADRWLRAMLGRSGFDFGGRVQDWRTVHQEGDRTTWTKVWEFRSSAAPETLMVCAARTMAASWKHLDDKSAPGTATSRWSFTDAEGGRWTAAADMKLTTDAAGPYRFAIRLDKVGTHATSKTATTGRTTTKSKRKTRRASAPTREGSVMIKRVTGLGGVFVKSRDPKAQVAWYGKHLGLEPGQGFDGGQFEWRQPDDPDRKGTTLWSFFPAASKYFDPSTSPFMINFRVANLHALLDTLRTEGVTIVGGPDDSDFGKFAWILDPEGNKVELWEPPADE